MGEKHVQKFEIQHYIIKIKVSFHFMGFVNGKKNSPSH